MGSSIKTIATLNSPDLPLLRERLRGTYLAGDPTTVVLPPGSESWPSDVRERLCRGLKPAGVLVPLIERNDGLTVLLTQRSAALKHHASQICFPGGRMEPEDSDIVVTALRETHEEVGIRPESVSVIGYLDAMPTVTGFAVTPVIGAVDPDVSVDVDHAEVEYAFEVPLAFLLDRRNAREGERRVHGRVIPIYEFQFKQHRIWGATAHMLLELGKKLA